MSSRVLGGAHTDPERSPVAPDHAGTRDASIDGVVDDPSAIRPSHPPDNPFINWGEFWSRDKSTTDWVLENVIAMGRGHSIYARHGKGKSLFVLWCATMVTAAGIVVIYLDYEMTEDDLRERLTDMGHGADSDLSLLRYLLLPTLPPLDTRDGGDALLCVVEGVQDEHPDHHIMVVIDTIGRAVSGDENSSDTIRDFYRHTGLRLKQMGCTWVRLDHAGWDDSKGARGASGKGDDVDVVWRLEEKDGGLDLVRVKSRMGWVPERVSLGKIDEPVLTYRPASGSWPSGTNEAAGDLDRLGFPLDGSGVAAVAALKAAGTPRRKVVVLAALRHRRMEREIPGAGAGTAIPPTRGTTAGTANQNRLIHRQEPSPEPPGTTHGGQECKWVSHIGEPLPSPTDDDPGSDAPPPTDDDLAAWIALATVDSEDT